MKQDDAVFKRVGYSRSGAICVMVLRKSFQEYEESFEETTFKLV
jgi:hypothetical protein